MSGDVTVRSASIGAGSRRGFTLVELLVVVALVAGMAALVVAGIGRGEQGAALQSAQAAMANVITAARAKAMASGMRVRILVHADVRDATRFRRFIALQQEAIYLSDDWDPAYERFGLPEGIAVLPGATRVPRGFYAEDIPWTKVSSSDALHSSAFHTTTVNVAVDRAGEEAWEVIQFTPFGTMSGHPGDVVLTTVARRAPGSFAEDESPVRAENIERVRGIAISIYGVPLLIDERAGF